MGCQQGKVSGQVSYARNQKKCSDSSQFNQNSQSQNNIVYTTQKGFCQKNNQIIKQFFNEETSNLQENQKCTSTQDDNQNINKSKSSYQFEKSENFSQIDKQIQIKSMQKIERQEDNFQQKHIYQKFSSNKDIQCKNGKSIEYKCKKQAIQSEQKILEFNQQQSYRNNQQYLNQDELILQKQIQEYEEEQQQKKQKLEGKQQFSNEKSIHQNSSQSISPVSRLSIKQLKQQKEMELIQQQLQEYRSRKIISLSEIENCIDTQQREQLQSLSKFLPKYQVTEEYVIERKKLKEIHNNAIPVLDTDCESSFLAIKRNLHIKCQIRKIKQIQAKQNNYVSSDNRNKLIDERLRNIYQIQ